jgi:transglutaminase-like putative cysteine protease
MFDTIGKLPRFTQQLIWVVSGFALAVLPHVPDLKVWVVLLACVCLALRIVIALRGWNLPPRLLRTAVALAAMLGVLMAYRTLNGLEAGTAFLVVMGAMKVIEARNARDLTVVIFVAYFLLFAGFLYHQSLLRLPWMLLSTWWLTAMLMRIHQTSPMSVREAIGLTGKMLLQALPVMVLLFLLFPRLPGQFWAMPARGSATTGLNDEMSPGDVSELSVSSAIAFRVRFQGEAPPPNQRYWRGPVLHDFDGRTWRRLHNFLPQEPLATSGAGYRYTLSLEPHNRPWVFGLDAVTEWPPERLRRTFDLQLLARDPIAATTTFTLRSDTAYRFGDTLPTSTRKLDLAPGERNPRAKQFAVELRERTGSDEAFVDAVLRNFRDEKFYYTLEPPRLAPDSVDDFLFNTRRGFCEHFASAFTMLARAGGIPARVVTGYQGGEFNPLGGYFIVRQSDAHAWSEVWLEGKGWVRKDPTAYVAPERIERGMDAAMGADEPVPDRLLRSSNALVQIRFAWDALNTFWNDQVIGFGTLQQLSLLEHLGIPDPDWQALGIGLALTLGAFFAALSVYLAWQFRPRSRDPILQIYTRLSRRLARRNLGRAPHEGPHDYLGRVMRARPDLAGELDEARSLYINLRYGPVPASQLTGSQLSRLKFLVSRLKV